MKKNFLLTALLVFTLIGFNQCKLLDKLTQFDVKYSTDYTIAATLGIGLLPDIATPPITTNSSQVFTNNNTRSDLLEKVLLKKLKLTITSPSDKKFDFLSSAEIFLSADGLPTIKVAGIDSIDDATVGNSIDLIPTTLDLKEYLKKSEIRLTVSTTTDKIVTSDVEVRIDATFFVDAKILGI